MANPFDQFDAPSQGRQVLAPGNTNRARKEEYQTQAAAFDPAKARADVTIAQANARNADTVASAEAAKARADAAKAQAELAIAQAKSKGKPVEEAQAELQRIINQIDNIRLDADDNGGWFETGWTGGLNRDRSGTAAFDLGESLKTIDANSAFSKLTQMRAESPTGGALGNVTEKELELLRSTVANLNPNQSHGSFLNALNTARNHYAGMLERVGGEAPPPPSKENLTTGAGYQHDPALAGIERRYRQMLGGGASASELIGFLDQSGIKGIDPRRISEQVAYRKSNPDVPLGRYDTSQIAMRYRDGTGAIGAIADSPLGAYGVAAANALTAGTLDEIVGATGGNAQQAQFAKEVLRERNPGSSILGDMTGAALGMTGLNAGLRGLGGRASALATRGGGIGSDALYGGLYGAGEANDNRLGGFFAGAGAGAGGNLIGRGLVSGLGRAARGVSSPDVQFLHNRGIPLTPGQILGQGGMISRGLRSVEDAVQSVPFLGAAIGGRRAEGLQAFNREAFGEALAPVGRNVGGQVGQDGIANAQEAVSQAYGNALSGVSLRADLPFVQDAGRAIRAGQRVPEFGADVSYLARENLGPTFGPGRTLSGEGFQSSLQDIGDTAADFRKAGNVRGRNAANAMGDLRQAYFGLANRQAPGTTAGLASANVANRNVSILGDAVTTAINGQVDSGIFTPAQLGRASINNTKKFGGKRKAAAGDVPFRELQEAGQAVLPSTVPNSGTMDRAWASFLLPGVLGGSALGAESLDMPAPVVGTLGALGLLSTKRGNAILQKLALDRPTLAQEIGEKLLGYRRPGGVIGGALLLPPAVNQ